MGKTVRFSISSFCLSPMFLLHPAWERRNPAGGLSVQSDQDPSNLKVMGVDLASKEHQPSSPLEFSALEFLSKDKPGVHSLGRHTDRNVCKALNVRDLISLSESSLIHKKY